MPARSKPTAAHQRQRIDMDIRDRVALVTGGSSGIGLATAKLLAAGGAHVWLVAQDEARLHTALAEVNAARARALSSS